MKLDNTCRIEGCCDNAGPKTGLCRIHYLRNYRHGSSDNQWSGADDLVGRVFGRWTVLSLIGPDRHQQRVWLCRCECGTERGVRSHLLLSGQSKSCGCWRSERSLDLRLGDLSGQRFGRWTVLHREINEHPPGSPVYWVCRCDCGIVRQVVSRSLTGCRSQSCGCLARELTATRKYRMGPPGAAARRSMFCNYRGGARIKGQVFSLTFEQFVALIESPCFYCGDLGSGVYVRDSKSGPFTGNGIDRYDNDVGYLTENCVSCCTACNFMKSSMHGDDFVARCQRIALLVNARLVQETS